MKKLLALLAVLAVVFAACGDDDDDAEGTSESTSEESEAEVHEVSVEAIEYGFKDASELEAGTVKFSMDNTGKEPHLLILGKLNDGKTFEDAKAFWSAATPQGPPPDTTIGAIPTTSPGLTATATWDVPEAGDYVFYCVLPAPDGQTHAAKGMIQAVEVTDGEVAGLPDADATVSAKDFMFEGVPPFKAGEESTVRLNNMGTQDHEFTLIEFNAGKGPADLAAFFSGQAPGPPPATFHGGVAVPPGGEGVFDMPGLETGKTYFFMCLIPDPADGKAHAEKGMAFPLAVS